MEFKEFFNDLMSDYKINLSEKGITKKIFEIYFKSIKNLSDIENSYREKLQLVEFKNLCKVAKNSDFIKDIYDSFNLDEYEKNRNFKHLISTIELLSTNFENSHISCFSYSYFMYVIVNYLAKDSNKLAKMGIEEVYWIDPSTFDYNEYSSKSNNDITFGFNRYHDSLKDFIFDENYILKKYKGHNSYVIIPPFIKGIAEKAFYNNKYVNIIYMNHNVVNIGKEAFYGCENLDSIHLSKNVTVLLSGTFENCLKLKRINTKYIKKLGNRTFKNCQNIDRINFDNLVSVGNECFDSCKKIKDFNFISNLNHIGMKAFNQCEIANVTFGNLDSIGGEAFANNKSLKEVNITSPLTKLGKNVFNGCFNIEFLSIDCKFNYNLFNLFCENLKDFNDNYRLLKKVKVYNLFTREFYNYENIKEITITGNTIVPKETFAQNKSVELIEFKQMIDSIGESAFNSCLSLKKIIMNYSGLSIPKMAFYSCENIIDYSFLNNVVNFGIGCLSRTNLSFFNFDRKFKKIESFAFANSIYPVNLKLDLSNTKCGIGSFHGVKKIDYLKINSLDCIQNKRIHFLFDKNLNDFIQNTKIINLVFGEIKYENMFRDFVNVEHIEANIIKNYLPKNTFLNCKFLKSVKLNGTINIIGSSAFMNCEKLTTLDAQFEQLKIKDHAFENCKNANNLINLNEVYMFGDYSFSNTNLDNLTLTDYTVFIGNKAFANNKIKKATLPFIGEQKSAKGDKAKFRYILDDNSVYNFSDLSILSPILKENIFDNLINIINLNLPKIVCLDSKVFNNKPTIYNLNIGKELKIFDNIVLNGLEKSTKITIDNECNNFTAINNNIFSKDKKILYYLADDKLDYYINHLNIIKSNSVNNLITNLNIKHDLKIENHAINGNGLVNINIENCKNISRDAIYDCNYLENIFIDNSYIDRIISLNGNCKNLHKITIKNSKVNGLFAKVYDCLKVQEMDLNNVESPNIFSKINNIETLKTERLYGYNPNGIFNNIDIENLNIDYLDKPLIIYFNKVTTLKSLITSFNSIDINTFKGISIEDLKINNVNSVNEFAFSNAKIKKLFIDNVKNIDEKAFFKSKINDFRMNNNQSCKILNKCLYCNDKLIYCFDKNIETYTTPLFVKEICSLAFEGCSFLTRLNLYTDNLKINTNVFKDCSIKNLTLKKAYCNSIKNTFGNNVENITFLDKEIRPKLFEDLTELLNINLKNCHRIGAFAFANCKSLKCIKGIEQAKYLGDYAFYNCSSLHSIEISKDAFYVGRKLFKNCSGLNNVTYPIDNWQLNRRETYLDVLGIEVSNITVNNGNIPENYFSNCKSNIIIDFNVESVNNYAFKNCTNLSKFNFNNVKSIGKEAFFGTILKDVTLDNVLYIGKNAFGSAVINTFKFGNKLSLMEEDVFTNTSIDNISGDSMNYEVNNGCLIDKRESSLFFVANNIQSKLVIDSDHIKRIKSNSFLNKKLSQIEFKNNIVIDKEAFVNCDKLNKVIFNKDLYTSGFIFNNCKNIENLSFNNFIIGDNYNISDLFNKVEDALYLTEVSLNSEIKKDNFLFDNNIETINILSDNLEIFDYYFSKCHYLSKINILGKYLKIGNYAFDNCIYLNSFEIPDTVKYIGEKIFNNCSNLTSLKIPFVGYIQGADRNIINLVGDSTHLIDLNITNDILYINEFSNCKTLEKIHFNNIKNIPDYCFENCINLEIIDDINDVEIIGKNAFKGTKIKNINLSKVKEIDEESFMNCKSLKYVTLTQNIVKIGLDTFKNCTSLKELTLPNLKNINDIASNTRIEKINIKNDKLYEKEFYYYESIKNITLLQNIDEIPANCFEGCINITNVPNEKSITKIAKDSFKNTGVVKLNLPSVKVIEKYSFENCKYLSEVYINKNVEIINCPFKNCENIKVVEVPIINKFELIDYGIDSNNVATISINNGNLSDGMFKDFIKLKDIKLHKNISNIPKNCFNGCVKLENVNLENIIKLDNNCFDGCSSLKTIDLGEKLKTIGNYAFANSGLVDIKLPKSLEKIGEYAFSNINMDIKELTIPMNVKHVGAFIFNQSFAPRKVYVYDVSDWDPNWKLGSINYKNKGLLAKSFGLLFNKKDKTELNVKYIGRGW